MDDTKGLWVRGCDPPI